MKDRILVPVVGRDRLDKMVSLIDSVAKPGMTIVFLVRSAANRCARLNAHLTAIQTGNVLALEVLNIRECGRLEAEQRSAEAKLRAVCKSLKSKGLQTEVRLYTGRFKKVLAGLNKDENIRFVLMISGSAGALTRALRAVVRVFNPINPFYFSPLLLINPDDGMVETKYVPISDRRAAEA